MKKLKLKILILSLIFCMLPGVIGSLFTAGSVDTWYITLTKPSFNPPSWIFAPVWTALYIVMGISLYLIWKEMETRKIKSAVIIFIIQLILNAFWSIIFFGLKNIQLALAEIIILWFTILICIILFYKISKPASLILVPYFLWVSFASVLNYEIMKLNI